MDQKYLDLIFQNEENSVRPEILLKKNIRLSSSESNHSLLLVRNIQEEILAIFSEKDSLTNLEYKFAFTTPNYGPFQYSWKKKSWDPSVYYPTKDSFLIQNIEFYRIPGDDFYSIFLEILSEEPPLPLFSVPMVYREGRLIWNGLEKLKTEKFLQENLKSSFQFDERNGRLNIVSPKGKVELVYEYREGRFFKR
jgi:hypothetical protein